MAIVLIIKTEDGQLAEIPVMSKIIIGRSSSSDLKIDDGKMSSKHCSFSLTKEGAVLFEDLSSTNGSFINNSRIMSTLMKVNDVIRVGNTLIRIDDKRLTPKERIAIGYNTMEKNGEATLPVLTQSQMGIQKAKEVKPGNKVEKKPTVVLNKELLKKKSKDENWNAGVDNVIEQEESSGMTKMLKLDKNAIKKKKT